MSNKPRNRPATDGPDTKVMFSYVHPTSVSRSWEWCKEQLLGYDLVNHGRVAAGGYDAIRCGTDGLPEARNMGVKALLESDCDWLFWIDTDMGFPPDIVDRLLEVSDPETRPVVGALCFLQKEEGPDGIGGYFTSPRPTIFDWRLVGENVHGFTPRMFYPVNAVVSCGATGSAAILIHRTVFEKIAAEYGPCWYDRQINPETGKLMSEDISFCVRAQAVGCPIYIHTGVKTSHHKERWLQEADYWQWVQAPPAAEWVDVFVPTRGRPQNAEPFMRSLRASTGLVGRVVAACNDDDLESAAPWEEAGAQAIVIPWEPGDYARKVNAAAALNGGAPWILMAGDDLRFHPGWLDHALAVAQFTGAKVIGTNDLGSPRVMAGEHATHILIARDYIDEVGASWDGPGIVCHEGYSHWFVDDEIVWAAKQRGVWAMALGSRVEHLHPIWGKGKHDETYELGQRDAEKDRRLFQRRATRFAGKVPVPA